YAKTVRCRRRGGEPAQPRRQRLSRIGGHVCQTNLGVQQEIRNATVPQLPNRAVEQKMVEIHQRGEDQEAAREVEMKYVAGYPGSGNEQTDSASDQYREIRQRTPLLAAFGTSLSPGVIAGDPQILRRVHHCQNACAVTALGNVEALAQG